MNGFRQKMAGFMYGRYGSDQLTRLLLGTALVCLALYLLFRLPLAYLMGMGLLFYSMYRSFSRNTARMAAQNQKYLTWRYKLAVKKNNAKKHWAQRSMYRIYRCPQCGQKVRVPRGRGRIAITCPKCVTEFIKKS